ncbi:MAG TPA: hypothetical protein PLE92_09085, partial [Lentisphaeria bacterium]|nr:hypothetical protein [Lentisphaeria bacterium]
CRILSARKHILLAIFHSRADDLMRFFFEYLRLSISSCDPNEKEWEKQCQLHAITNPGMTQYDNLCNFRKQGTTRLNCGCYGYNKEIGMKKFIPLNATLLRVSKWSVHDWKGKHDGKTGQGFEASYQL